MIEEEDLFTALRKEMVQKQIEGRGIADRAVLAALRRVPRHLFVPEELRGQAYCDRPLPIGPEQTISQPYIVAYMLAELQLKAGSKVLEIGTGSGYQTALLAELVGSVYSLELDEGLSRKAIDLLVGELGYKNVHIRCGDGYRGWHDQGPFDAIIVSAAPSMIPRELVRQLAPGGRMILPLGTSSQYLILLEKTPDGLKSKELCGVRFVPMREEDA